MSKRKGAGRGTVGKLSVKVVPDLSEFHKELRRRLKEIQRTTDMDLPVGLVVPEEDLERIRQQVASLADTVSVHADLSREDLERIRKRLNDLDGARVRVAAEADETSLRNTGERVREAVKDVSAEVNVKPNVQSLRRSVAEIRSRVGDVSVEARLDDTAVLGQLARLQDDVATREIPVVAELRDADVRRALKRLTDDTQEIPVVPRVSILAMRRAQNQLSDLKVSPDVDEGALQRVAHRIRSRLRSAYAGRIAPEVSEVEIARLRRRIESAAKRIDTDVHVSETARARLRRDVDKIRLNLDADVHLDRSSLRKVKRQLKRLDQDVTVNADADTGKARMKLLALARDRIVKIRPVLDNVATAKVASALAALSGGRALKDTARDLKDLVTHLDQTALKAGIAASAVAALVSGIGVLTGTVGVLGKTLAQMTPGLLAFPGMLAGLGVGATTLLLSLKDFGDAMEDVKNQFSDLRKSLSASFWDAAADSVRSLANDAMPLLKTRLDAIAAAQGRWLAAMSDVAHGRLDVIDELLGNTQDAAERATTGFADMAAAILDVGAVGSRYLPRLIDYTNKQAQAFRKWVEARVASGQMEQSIESAITASRQLWTAMKNLTGGVIGFFDAANKAGYSLEHLVSVTARFNAAINSDNGQTALSNLFSGMSQGADNVINKLSGLGTQFVSMSENAKTSLAVASSAFGEFAAGVIEVAARPEIGAGLTGFFQGIESGASKLRENAGPISEVLGNIASLAGTVADTVGGVLSTAFRDLGPIFSEVLVHAKPLVESLGHQLEDAITKVSPPLKSFVEKAVIPLMDAVAKDPDSLMKFVTALLMLKGASEVVSAVKPVADTLQSIQTISTLLAGAGGFGGVVSAAGSVMAAIAPIALTIGAVVGALVLLWNYSDEWREVMKECWQDVKDAFADVWEFLKQTWEDIKDVFKAFEPEFSWLGDRINDLAGVFKAAWDMITSIIQTAWELIKNAVHNGLDAVHGIIDMVLGILTLDFGRFWDGLKRAVGAVVQGLLGSARAVLKGILGVFSGAGSLLYNVGRAILRGLIDGFKSMWGNVKSSLGRLTNWITKWKGPEATDRVLLRPAGRMIIGGLIEGLEDRYPDVKDSLGALTRGIGNEVRPGDDGLGGYASGGGPTVNITNYYPVEQPDSAVRDQAASGIRLAASLV